MKYLLLISAGLLLLFGCENSPTANRSEHDRISQEIDELRAKAEEAASESGNIRVVVNLLSTNTDDYFAVDALWRYVDENVTVSNRPANYRRSGLKIGVGNDHFRARLNITKKQLKSSEDTELFLVLADGANGSIFIGKEIYVPSFFYANRWYRRVEYGFRQAGRSMDVRVRKLPSGRIEMELTPVFSDFLNDQGDLKLTELSTTVTAQPGQTIVIGGGDTSEENVANALFSYSKSNEKKKTLITVTPHL